MANVSYSVIVLLGLVATTFAALALGPAVVHQNEPGKCYESEAGKYHAPGESWSIDNCAQATCYMTNQTGTPNLMVSYASCGVVHAEPPCYIKEDTSLQYPHCCPQPICPEDYEPRTVSSQESLNEDDGSYHQESSSANGDNEFNDEENEIEGSNSHFSDVPYYSLVQFDRNGKLDSDDVEINYSDMKPISKEMSKNNKYYNGESSISSKFPETESMESRILPYLFPQYTDYQDDYFSDYNTRTRKFSPRFHYMEPSYTDSSYQWF